MIPSLSTSKTTPARAPVDGTEWKDEVAAIGHTMSQVSACGLGIAAPLITQSLVRLFPDQVDAHLAQR